MSWQEGFPCPSYHFPFSIYHFQFPAGAGIVIARRVAGLSLRTRRVKQSSALREWKIEN
jgi:hypothetical protein